MKSSLVKEPDFLDLTNEVKNCVACPRMLDSKRVIGAACGSLNAPILIVGEAPGRLGADESAIPFHGDKAGDNFESLLEHVGLSRHDCFITNAALCNPRDAHGNNATPTRKELHNCSAFLRRQIDLVDPGIVVTLGAQALNAIKSIEPHEIELSSGVRKKWSWYSRILIPLYHPGQRAMIHRSFHNQLADYRFLAETYAHLSGRTRRAVHDGSPSSTPVARVATRLIGRTGNISYFALHKLFFLAEYEYFKRTGRRMTTAYIVRQKDGPYVFELHFRKLKKAIDGLNIWSNGGRLMFGLRDRLELFEYVSELGELEEDKGFAIDHVVEKYGKADDSELKRIVYLTTPMRKMLRREKIFREDTFNKAIDFFASDVVVATEG